MTRPLLIALILIAYIIYVGFKHKETWKKLSIMQTAGVLVTFVGIISIAGVILFYGSRFITDAISGDITGFIIKFLGIVVIIVAAAVSFTAIAGKITNGVIPITRRDQK